MSKQTEEANRNPRQLMRVEFPSPLKDNDHPDREFGGIELIGYLMNTQPQFTMDKAGLQSAMRLEIAMRQKTNLTPLLIEWRDLQLLISAAAKPRNGYPIQPALACLPFINAFDVATEHVPTESIGLGEASSEPETSGPAGAPAAASN